MRTSAAYPLGRKASSAAKRLETARYALVLAESAAGISSVVVLPDRTSHGEAVPGAATGGATPREAPSDRVWSGAASGAARWREASSDWAIPEYLTEILPRELESGMSVGFSGSVLMGLLLAGIVNGSGA